MTIQDYLPKKSPHLQSKKTKRASGLVPAKDYDEVSQLLKEQGLSWNDFLTACFKSFLDEEGKYT